MTADQERAAVVDWLRGEAAWNRKTAKYLGERGRYSHAAPHDELALTIERWADAIERGEHLRGGE